MDWCQTKLELCLPSHPLLLLPTLYALLPSSLFQILPSAPIIGDLLPQAPLCSGPAQTLIRAPARLPVSAGEFWFSDGSLADRSKFSDPGLMPLPDTASGLDWSHLVDAARAFEGNWPWLLAAGASCNPPPDMPPKPCQPTLTH